METPPIETPVEISAPAAEAAPSDSAPTQAVPPGRAWSERFIQPIKYSRSNFKDASGKHLIAFRFDLPAGTTKPSEELLAVLRNSTAIAESELTQLGDRPLRDCSLGAAATSVMGTIKPPSDR